MHQDLKDLLDLLVTKDFKVQLELQDLQAREDRMVLQVLMVLLVHKETKDPQVTPVFKGHQEVKDQLDRLGQRVLQVRLEIGDNPVLQVTKGQLDQRAQVEILEILV